MRVLIPVDGSVSCRNALDLLAARARRMQVKPEVSLINVQHPVPMGVMTQFGLDAVRAAAEEEAKGIFSDLEGSIAVRELNPEEKIGFGIPGEVISKEAEDEDCDLIIMGARGISPAKSFFLGSVSRNVLANTMKPVLLARGESLPDRENLRLVLAVDGSNYGAAAAKFISENPGFFGPAPEVSGKHAPLGRSDGTRPRHSQGGRHRSRSRPPDGEPCRRDHEVREGPRRHDRHGLARLGPLQVRGPRLHGDEDRGPYAPSGAPHPH